MSNRSRFGALLRGFAVCALGAYLLTVGMFTTIDFITGGHIHETCRNTRSALHSPSRRDVVPGSQSTDADEQTGALLGKATAFGSLQAAAIAALKSVIPLSSDYEWGGIIVEYRGKFYVATAVTDQSHASIKFDADVPAPLVLAATYHTHPCDPKYLSSKFSAQDVFSAAYADVPAFMADVCDGTIREFDPDHTSFSAKALAHLLGGGWADGTVVYQPPIA